MTDLLAASQDAFFAGLNVAAVTTLAPVFTSVPPDQQPPFVEIGVIDAEEFEPVKLGSGVEKHTVEVAYRWRGDTRMPLLAMMHAGRSALEGAGVAAAGARFDCLTWRGSATDRDDDGVTWFGAQRFDVLVQQG